MQSATVRSVKCFHAGCYEAHVCQSNLEKVSLGFPMIGDVRLCFLRGDGFCLHLGCLGMRDGSRVHFMLQAYQSSVKPLLINVFAIGFAAALIDSKYP